MQYASEYEKESSKSQRYNAHTTGAILYEF